MKKMAKLNDLIKRWGFCFLLMTMTWQVSSMVVHADTKELKTPTVDVTAIPRGDLYTDYDKERRNTTHNNLEVTGLFLPRGEEITVEVKENPENVSLVIGQYGKYENLNSAPESIGSNPVDYQLTKGINHITREDSDGMVYIRNQSYDQTIHVTLTGGVEVPEFRLGGKNNQATFFQRLNDSTTNVPFFVIEGKYVFGTFQMSELKNITPLSEDRLNELASYWDKVYQLTVECYGFNNQAGYAAEKNMNQRIHIANPDSGAGYAYATNNYISFQIDTGASQDILGSKPTDQQWGFWHEMGHTFQTPQYKFDGMTEVTVNISSMYVQQKLGFPSRLASSSTQKVIDDYFNIDVDKRDFSSLGDELFAQLGMFWSLERVFGLDYYKTVSQLYRTMETRELPSSNDEEIQTMVKVFSQAANRNLVPYFNQWGIKTTAETEKYCQQFKKLEKEIWKDVDGRGEDYALPGAVKPYTIPTLDSFTLTNLPIFTTAGQVSLENLKSIPLASPTKISNVYYQGIGNYSDYPGNTIKLTNENGVSNVLPIKEVTGGEAVKLFGNAYGYQIIVPNLQTKTFSMVGNSGKLHFSWGDDVYVTIQQYDHQMKQKKAVELSGEEDSDKLSQMFKDVPYEIGDYVHITHEESGNRIERYHNSELIPKDDEKSYWYQMTDKGWKEVDLKPVVTSITEDLFLGLPVDAKQLVDTSSEKNIVPITKVEYVQVPDFATVGQTSTEIKVTNSVGETTTVSNDELTILGGEAVKLFGNAYGYQIIVPNPETKTFSMVGKSGKLHQSWGNDVYVTIQQYDRYLKQKKAVELSGEEDSDKLSQMFKGAPYEIGDYVHITHEESDNRIERYHNSELIPNDDEKSYWYQMTDKGWKSITEEELPEETKGTIQADQYILGKTTITGRYYGNVKKARLTVNGKVISWGGTFNSDGTFSYYCGPKTISAGDTVVLDAFDEENKLLDTATLTITSYSGAITMADYQLGASVITGTYTGDVRMAHLTINGQSISWGGTFKDGTFTYYVKPSQIKDGDKVSIQGYDPNQHSLGEEQPVNLKKVTGKITQAVKKQGSTVIEGTYEGDIYQGRLTVNGKVISWGGAFKDGKFTYYIGQLELSETDTVVLEGVDKNKNIIENSKINVTYQKSEVKVTDLSYTLGTQTISGTYQGEVKKGQLFVNGKSVSWGGSFAEGNIDYYVKANQIKSGDKVTMNLYAPNGHQISEGNVVTIKEK
ncbi:immunoglobulin-like domain-containing protein [Enterococcus sp. C57]|uniref:immunoglobulin-like domain-containing protein n=1 Tax=Enterococcus sp. C57 TaxID=3231318 RepID=UPI0034A02B11